MPSGYDTSWPSPRAQETPAMHSLMVAAAWRPCHPSTIHTPVPNTAALHLSSLCTQWTMLLYPSMSLYLASTAPDYPQANNTSPYTSTPSSRYGAGVQLACL